MLIFSSGFESFVHLRYHPFTTSKYSAKTKQHKLPQHCCRQWYSILHENPSTNAMLISWKSWELHSCREHREFTSLAIGRFDSVKKKLGRSGDHGSCRLYQNKFISHHEVVSKEQENSPSTYATCYLNNYRKGRLLH